MENQLIKLSDLRKVSGIGEKTIERIKEMLLTESEDVYISEYNKDLHLDINSINHGDCLELMNGIPDKSIDMILCDLPYQITQNKWDVLIPFDNLWKQYNRIIKDNGAIVLFGSQPFTSKLINSNSKMFKYEWIWRKNRGTGHLNAKKIPMKSHESIAVFYKNPPIYNPQMREGNPYKRINCSKNDLNKGNYGKTKTSHDTINNGSRYPLTVLDFPVVEKTLHPNEKSTDLLEYLIKTYTNEGQVVLDNCMGSGSTIVACKNTNRDYIGIEMDREYFEIAEERIESA